MDKIQHNSEKASRFNRRIYKIEEKDVESQYIMYVFRDMDKLNPTGEMNGDSV
jgi:hypothetical protein